MSSAEERRGFCRRALGRFRPAELGQARFGHLAGLIIFGAPDIAHPTISFFGPRG
jgi:hypothetical protein